MSKINGVVILKSIYAIGFLLANLVAWRFFDRFVPGIPFEFFLIPFFSSFIVLKTDILIWILSSLNLKEIICFIMRIIYLFIARIGLFFILLSFFMVNVIVFLLHGILQLDIKSLKKAFRVTAILIFFKLMFFNVLYELFPVYIIWIGLIGLLYLLRILTQPPINSFFQIINTINLLLGFFQFFLNRQEQKIASKITIDTKRIDAIIAEETDFEKFSENLSIKQTKEQASIRNWILKETSPELQGANIIKILAEDGYLKDIYTQTRGKKSPTIPISFNIPSPDSNKKYEIIEAAAKSKPRMKKELIEAYENFFKDPRISDRILDRIDKEINFKEYRILTLSNINIFYEIIPEFTNNAFSEFFEKTTYLQKCPTSANLKCESSVEFRSILSYEMHKAIFDKIIS